MSQSDKQIDSPVKTKKKSQNYKETDYPVTTKKKQKKPLTRGENVHLSNKTITFDAVAIARTTEDDERKKNTTP